MTSRIIKKNIPPALKSVMSKNNTSLSGIFAVRKPVGPTSQDIVASFKHYFQQTKIFQNEFQPKGKESKNIKKKHNKWWLKVGHGGTLDPLAEGVLVIGVGNGTKKLQSYLDGSTKTYRAIALLGSSTTTYDSQGRVLERTPTGHVTNEMVEQALEKFRGVILQTPPVFSAIKMNGKPLYEYARKGKALPREIEPRKCKIDLLEVVGGGLRYEHSFREPTEAASEEEKEFARQLNTVTKTVLEENEDGKKDRDITVTNEPVEESKNSSASVNPILEIKFSVSSGTYIRSLIHDLGLALGTTAHMVQLTRLSQGPWEMDKNVFEVDFILKNDPSVWEAPLRHYITNGPETELKSLVNEKTKSDASLSPRG